MVFLGALAGAMPYTSGQIIVVREDHGKNIACALRGPQLWGRPCGIDGNYANIFVGSVLSVTEISETEKRLQVTPQEIFLGDDVSQLTVTTNQGACLPEILPGAQWLFYLRRDDNTNELLLDYGSPSEPISDAQSALTTLRRLAVMTDQGLISGNLQRGVRNVGKDGTTWTTFIPVPKHKVIAKRESDGAEYSALSDSDGDYEFEPLPSGSYHLSTNTVQGLWAEEGSATVHSRSCTAFRFELHVDGSISGHVTATNGKPLKIQPWVEIVSENGEQSASSYADELGYFVARGLEPGRYIVGIGIQAEPDTPAWRSRVYYPSVGTQEKATVIGLGKAEKRTNVDFRVPNSVSR